MVNEQPLTGGNTSVVVRIDDTVRRGAGHWTPAVHALLAHLRATGFGDVPEVLGFDERQREVLRFVPGAVGTLSEAEPLDGWFLTPEACHAIGCWLARFHVAQRGWQPDPDLPWRLSRGRLLQDGEVVCHHDVSPYNTVRRPDGGVTVLDWDFARPGRPVEDLAWAAWRWCPLMEPAQHVPNGFGRLITKTEQRANLAALMDGYGWRDSAALLEEVVRQQLTHAADLEALADTGDVAFGALVAQGYARGARADAQWLTRSAFA